MPTDALLSAPSPMDTDSAPACAGSPLHASVTCVTWTAGGRLLGLGTMDGFVLFSTEVLLQEDLVDCTVENDGAGPSAWASSSSTTFTGAAEETELRGGQLVEVCRRTIHGGVGVLSLFGQCSVVAVAGTVRSGTAATVRIVDASRECVPVGAERSVPLQPSNSSTNDGTFIKTSVVHRQNLGTDGVYDHEPETVATATFPADVMAVQFTPHFVLVAVSGYSDIQCSHKLFVFDRHLRKRAIFDAYPPSHNHFLAEMMATACMWSLKSIGGRTIHSFRALIPGTAKGEVRRLALWRVSKAEPQAVAANSNARLSPGTRTVTTNTLAAVRDDEFRFTTAKMHSSALRAVAISQDGTTGVSVSESVTKVVISDLSHDDRIVRLMTLERGFTPGVNNSVSLAIVSISQVQPSVTAGVAVVREMVALITSSGTIHLYACDTHRQEVLRTDNKALRPKEGFPYSFWAVFPESTVSVRQSSLLVLQCTKAESLSAKAEGAVVDGYTLQRVARFDVNTTWGDGAARERGGLQWSMSGRSAATVATGSISCTLSQFHNLQLADSSFL